MLKDDEGQKYQEDQGWTVCEKASPQVGSQSVLSQQRDSKLRSKQTARWQVSSVYPNVIMVDFWRKVMDEQAEMKKLFPFWRQTLLSAHSFVSTVLRFVWLPVTLVTEQLDGTASMRTKLAKMEKSE
ncbi:MAG TPA: hypothetical protein VI423_10340 [Paenisporosarcina sp.]|nr:hypothetical protein [Paenisporosarcina sp.]